MMNLITLTVAFTVALVLASVLCFAMSIAVMTNAKAMQWFMKRYMAAIEKSIGNLDDYMKGGEA